MPGASWVGQEVYKNSTLGETTTTTTWLIPAVSKRHNCCVVGGGGGRHAPLGSQRALGPERERWAGSRTRRARTLMKSRRLIQSKSPPPSQPFGVCEPEQTARPGGQNPQTLQVRPLRLEDAALGTRSRRRAGASGGPPPARKIQPSQQGA